MAMNAGQVIERLIKIGMATKASYEQARQDNGSLSWSKFARSKAFKDVQREVGTLLEGLTQDDVTKAVQRIRRKQKAFLAGRKIFELPIEDLLQFGKLADAESILVRKEMKKLGASSTFLWWLQKDALPVLADVAKIVIPLVL